ncbi:hypothetical protein EPUS_00245 [Endocarpon pusillum Z07020]|uniref:Uncharacterized protein n=1 Tax=Endocarpon pusillum (strain Z07020 / HMAS-L-300199) TaxID=1263415 RepID=U1GDA7_ENDPU|nr:uncharacterized protein EPUS_00245 [Endocarpon pusillum Z07020]ERF70058.1 hypothetical protein EPUS_00245 [Endocarpon pusillum Z07020]
MAMVMAVVMDDDDIDATRVNVNDESDVQGKYRISVSNDKGILRRRHRSVSGCEIPTPTPPTPPQLMGEVGYYQLIINVSHIEENSVHLSMFIAS